MGVGVGEEERADTKDGFLVKVDSDVIQGGIKGTQPHCHHHSDYVTVYWAIQRSWFARVNALCNLSRKMSREVAAHFRDDF